MMANQSTAGPGRKILVIDDDEIALEAIREVLASAGYQVQCLSSPIGATQVIVNQGIEAVVVDLNMPVMRGDRFISLLRSWDRIRDIPTVLISGSDAETLKSAASGIAGVHTVTKDGMRRGLPQVLERVLSRDKGQGAARRTTELGVEERRTLARGAQTLLNALTGLRPEQRSAWEPVVAGFRNLREQAEPAGFPALLKTLSKASDVVEYCVERAQLSPEAKLTLSGLLDTLANIEKPGPASNPPAMLVVHLARLERLLEERST